MDKVRKELCKRWHMLNPTFRKIAQEYKRKYGFIWTDEYKGGNKDAQ